MSLVSGRDLSDAEFERLINWAMDELPQDHIQNLDNVAITFADAPTPEQLEKNNVSDRQILLGLYEGIPQTARFSASYSGVVPDKITLFKNSLLAATHDDQSLFALVKRTLWHEIAHHYGLNHEHIYALERKNASDNFKGDATL